MDWRTITDNQKDVQGRLEHLQGGRPLAWLDNVYEEPSSISLMKYTMADKQGVTVFRQPDITDDSLNRSTQNKNAQHREAIFIQWRICGINNGRTGKISMVDNPAAPWRRPCNRECKKNVYGQSGDVLSMERSLQNKYRGRNWPGNDVHLISTIPDELWGF